MKFHHGFLTIAGVVVCALSMLFGTACFFVIHKATACIAALKKSPLCAPKMSESIGNLPILCICNGKQWYIGGSKKAED